MKAKAKPITYELRVTFDERSYLLGGIRYSLDAWKTEDPVGYRQVLRLLLKLKALKPTKTK